MSTHSMFLKSLDPGIKPGWPAVGPSSLNHYVVGLTQHGGFEDEKRQHVQKSFNI